MTPKELKSARHALGLTQQGLAERLFITREHVAQMERGARSITHRTAMMVAALVKAQSGGRTAAE